MDLGLGVGVELVLQVREGMAVEVDKGLGMGLWQRGKVLFSESMQMTEQIRGWWMYQRERGRQNLH